MLCCAAVCFDTKAVGIGLAIYTLLIALFSGFVGPVIAGALVQELGGFGQAMAANGAFMLGAAFLMAGLSVWERRRARAAALEEEEHHQHIDETADAAALVGSKDAAQQDELQDASRRGHKNDVELARMQQ